MTSCVSYDAYDKKLNTLETYVDETVEYNGAIFLNNSDSNNMNCLLSNLNTINFELINRIQDIKDEIGDKNVNKTNKFLEENKSNYNIIEKDKNASIMRYYETELMKLISKVGIFSKLALIIFFSYLCYKKIRNTNK